MNTRKPIQAKTTGRLLRSVFPAHFKMVEDRKSNGYKFANLLFGAELDATEDASKAVYGDSFLDSFDVSRPYEVYQVDISGAPNIQTLRGDGQTPIKITNESEFYNGDPTRVIYNKRYILPILATTSGTFNTDNSFESGFYTQCWSRSSGVVGLEYFRENERGSGHLVVFAPMRQEESYGSGVWPAHRIDINTNFQNQADFDRTYGFFTGIKNQNYTKTGRYEVLHPITERTLSGLYPMYRDIIDESGVASRVVHYTPNRGWTRDENSNPVAVVDYTGEYYYDSKGTKIYYRTAYNNPYGYGNYTTAYVDLEHTPISGTLKLYDIDILDISGNAIEIPRTGKNIYYYKSDRMLIGNSGGYPGGDPNAQFDPIYLGYDQLVPSGKGFSPYSEGKATTLYRNISWNYLHEGGGIASGSLQYVDGSGRVTNRLQINNPQTRYMVEYLYKTHDNAMYMTSLSSNNYVSLESINPVYTVNLSGQNLEEVPFRFTSSPLYRDTNEQAKILTFDGLTTRPFKYMYRVDFNIPMTLADGDLDRLLFVNGKDEYIGFSNEFIPIESTTQRNYVLNCPFDEDTIGNTVTESDLTGNSNDFEFYNTGNAQVIKVNYGDYYGKKILRGNENSYFQVSGVSFMRDYTFLNTRFKVRKPDSGRIIELQDNTTSQYLHMDYNNQGMLSVECSGYIFYGRENMSFNDKSKEITLKYVSDNLSDSVPTFELYYKEEDDIGLRQIPLTRADRTPETVSTLYLRAFKNCSVDIDFFKIYYEVQ